MNEKTEKTALLYNVRERTLPQVLCDSCKHLHSVELVKGHRRRGFCACGHGWVEMGKPKQCLYHEFRGGDGRR